MIKIDVQNDREMHRDIEGEMERRERTRKRTADHNVLSLHVSLSLTHRLCLNDLMRTLSLFNKHSKILFQIHNFYAKQMSQNHIPKTK